LVEVATIVIFFSHHTGRKGFLMIGILSPGENSLFINCIHNLYRSSGKVNSPRDMDLQMDCNPFPQENGQKTAGDSPPKHSISQFAGSPFPFLKPKIALVIPWII